MPVLPLEIYFEYMFKTNKMNYGDMIPRDFNMALDTKVDEVDFDNPYVIEEIADILSHVFANFVPCGSKFFRGFLESKHNNGKSEVIRYDSNRDEMLNEIHYILENKDIFIKNTGLTFSMLSKVMNCAETLYKYKSNEKKQYERYLDFIIENFHDLLKSDEKHGYLSIVCDDQMHLYLNNRYNVRGIPKKNHPAEKPNQLFSKFLLIIDMIYEVYIDHLKKSERGTDGISKYGFINDISNVCNISDALFGNGHYNDCSYLRVTEFENLSDEHEIKFKIRIADRPPFIVSQRREWHNDGQN